MQLWIGLRNIYYSFVNKNCYATVVLFDSIQTFYPINFLFFKKIGIDQLLLICKQRRISDKCLDQVVEAQFQTNQDLLTSGNTFGKQTLVQPTLYAREWKNKSDHFINIEIYQILLCLLYCTKMMYFWKSIKLKTSKVV